MTKRVLLPVLLVCLLSVAFALAAVMFTNFSFPRQTGGRLVFPQTVEQGLQLDRILVRTPDNHKITLLLENDFWLVKEEDYYYANIELLNELFTSMNTARYHHQQPFSAETLAAARLLLPGSAPAENAGTLIETFAGNAETPLERIIIGKQSANRLFYFARPADKDEVWLIDGSYTLPADNYSWLMQPVLDYPAEMIEKVVINDKKGTAEASRGSKDYPFFTPQKKVVMLNAFLERFNFFITEKVASAQNFDETRFPEHRRIELVTFSGLVTAVDLFHDNSEFWVKISLSTTALPTAAVNAYIRDNNFLYEGWFFKIPASTGKVLANFNIEQL